MKILFCSHEQFWPLTIGGSAGNLKIVEKMGERGHDVTVATPLYLDSIKKSEISKKFKVKLMPFSPFYIDRYIKLREFKYVIYAILFVYHLAKLLFKNKYDIVFFRNCVLGGTCLVLKPFTKVPFYLSMTDFLSGFLYEDDRYPKFFVNFLFELERNIGRKFVKTFVITPNMKEDLKKGGYSGENIIVSYDGVDIHIFNPDKVSPQEIEKVYQEIGFKANKDMVLYHGTIQPDAVELFYKIIFNTLQKKPDVKFVIIGGGSGYTGLHKQINHPNVKFMGFISHEKLYKYIAACNIGIIPYRRTFNSNVILTLKILEYLAMGNPVVSTNLETIKEIFSHYGFVKISYDPEEFSDNIIKCLNMEKSNNAIRLIREKFSWDHVTEIICKAIEETEGVIF